MGWSTDFCPMCLRHSKTNSMNAFAKLSVGWDRSLSFIDNTRVCTRSPLYMTSVCSITQLNSPVYTKSCTQAFFMNTHTHIHRLVFLLDKDYENTIIQYKWPLNPGHFHTKLRHHITSTWATWGWIAEQVKSPSRRQSSVPSRQARITWGKGCQLASWGFASSEGTSLIHARHWNIRSNFHQIQEQLT